MRPASDHLTVLYDGIAIGVVNVTRRSPRKVFGTFEQGRAFRDHQTNFDAASRLAKAVTDSIDRLDGGDGSTNYQAFDEYIAVIERLNQHVRLPQLGDTVEEFSIDENGSVEVTVFAEPV